MKSRWVCARCGVAVYMWGAGAGFTWKHATGGWRGPKSCGQKPMPVERTQYEAAEAAAIRGALK